MYQFLFLSLLLATLGSFTTVLSAASPDDLVLEVLYEEGEPIGYKIRYGLNMVGELVIPAEYPFGDEGETLPIIEIEHSAFEEVEELTSVTIPGTVKTIGWSAFTYCTALESVTMLEGGVTYIGDSAFGFTPLTSVSLPQSLKRIDIFAFNGCASLTSITIPSGVTHIDGYAFFRATALQNIYFEGPAPSLSLIHI